MMRKIFFLVFILFFSIGCKSIKKDKSSTTIEQTTVVENTQEVKNNNESVQSDTSETDSYQEVIEETETRNEVVYHPDTNEAIILPVTRSVTTTRTKINDKVVSTVTQSESSEAAILSTEQNDIKGDSTSVYKESEGQEADEIVGSITSGLVDGVLKALFGNTIKWVTTLTIVALIIILLVVTRKKSKNNS